MRKLLFLTFFFEITVSDRPYISLSQKLDQQENNYLLSIFYLPSTTANCRVCVEGPQNTMRPENAAKKIGRNSFPKAVSDHPEKRL